MRIWTPEGFTMDGNLSGDWWTMSHPVNPQYEVSIFLDEIDPSGRRPKRGERCILQITDINGWVPVAMFACEGPDMAAMIAKRMIL